MWIDGNSPVVNLRKAYYLFALACLLLLFMSTAEASAASRIKVTLLGDSYIAGNGARKSDGSTDNYGPKDCYRSNSNWGKKYIEQLRSLGNNITLINRACSGSVTNDLLYDNDMDDDGHWIVTPSFLGVDQNDPDEVIYDAIKNKYQCEKRETEEEYYRFHIKQKTDQIIEFGCTRFVKAQLNFVDESSDVVIVSVGGNDAEFAAVVTNCFAPVLSSSNACREQVRRSAGFSENENAYSYKRNMGEIFKRLREKLRSDAKVVLVGYPYLAKDDNFVLNDLFGPGSYEASKNVRELGRLGDEVQRGVIPEHEPDKAGIYYFDGIKEHFVGYEPDMGDFWHNSEKWINTFGSRLPTDWFHYNPRGHQEVANVLYQKLEDQVDGFPLRTQQDYDVVFIYNEASEANFYQRDDMAIKGLVIGGIRNQIVEVANTYRFAVVAYNRAEGSNGKTGPKSQVNLNFTSSLAQLSTKVPRFTNLLGRTQHGELKNALHMALDLKWRPGVKKLIYIVGKTTGDDEGLNVHEHYADVVKKALEIDPVAISPIMAANNSLADTGSEDESAKYLATHTAGSYNQQAKRNDYTPATVGQQINDTSVTAPYAWAGEGLNAKIGEEVALDGSGSYDTNGITQYQWDVDLDGTYEISSTEPVSEYVFDEGYEGLITLKVTNASGKFATATFKAVITRDGDSIDDELDNCIDDWNEDQSDVDEDGIGDVCDDAPGLAGYQDPNVISDEDEQNNEAPDESSETEDPPTLEREEEPVTLLPNDPTDGASDSPSGQPEEVLASPTRVARNVFANGLRSFSRAANPQSFADALSGGNTEQFSGNPPVQTTAHHQGVIKKAFAQNSQHSTSSLLLLAAGSVTGLGAAMGFMNLRLLEEEEL